MLLSRGSGRRARRLRNAREGRLGVPNEADRVQFVSFFDRQLSSLEGSSLRIYPFSKSPVLFPILRDSTMPLNLLKPRKFFEHVIPRKRVDETPVEAQFGKSLFSQRHYGPL